MTDRIAYSVTILGGTGRVGGRRVKAGDRLELTESAARYELLNGTIEPASKPARKGAKGRKPTPAGEA